jgi:hypothetical protein
LAAIGARIYARMPKRGSDLSNYEGMGCQKLEIQKA